MELEPFKKKAPFSPTFLITLFLYGIGAYIYFIRVVYLTIIITLFLYGIGAQMQQTQVQTQTQNYIIPIWNWSQPHLFICYCILWITLFLYGIGACLSQWTLETYPTITLFLYGIGANLAIVYQHDAVHYIIPIWNWSFNTLSLLSLPTLLHYSYMELEHAFYFVECWMWINYIISIWNWSFASRYFWYNSTYITLFLYGIGAML